MFATYIHQALYFLSILFVCSIGLLLLLVVVLYIIDITQTKHTIRHNYPVIGRFRYVFEHLGEFFRQYFFAMDREEMPFNRALRTWVYRASKDSNLTIAFGSTRNLNQVGEAMFLNSAFPTLDEEAIHSAPMLIGPNCRQPYLAPSFFNISGMSYGALSKVAVTALAQGAARAGCWLNTGEGGLAPYHLKGNCDVVFQIGTAKYGVRDHTGRLADDKLRDLAAKSQIKMFELKLSQGAKPGKGGILPAAKVDQEIAAIRGIPIHQASISPNRHPEVKDNEQLLDMIAHIRDVTGKPVGIKTVIGQVNWITEFCQAILHRGKDSAPDFITIDSADGGSGAAPQPLMDFVGLTLKEALPLCVDELERMGLRERIKIIASGKLVNPGNVALALATGADFVVSARGFMFSLGCIQALQCNKNTCPTGITTHDHRLQKGLDPEVKAVRVANYHKNMVESVGTIAHACGVSEARNLRRDHVRIVSESGMSIPLAETYPEAIKFIDTQ